LRVSSVTWTSFGTVDAPPPDSCKDTSWGRPECCTSRNPKRVASPFPLFRGIGHKRLGRGQWPSEPAARRISAGASCASSLR
jgi:hypothetical protein